MFRTWPYKMEALYLHTALTTSNILCTHATPTHSELWGVMIHVLNTHNSILESCVMAHKCAHDSSLQFMADYDLAPIWNLPFIFEQLVFGPNPD